MDEILVANFMVFDDLLDEEPYDLVVGDEAWEVDHFLHENPELKRTAFAWMTDFVGWLPMPDGGEREAALTADYNAEMVEHVGPLPADPRPGDLRRQPRGHRPRPVRPRPAGHPGVDRGSTSTSPATSPASTRPPWPTGPRSATSSATAPDEQVCVVTVGGSGVGGGLLRRVIAAYPHAKRRLPGLRMVVVAGPRIDPASLPRHDGLEVHALRAPTCTGTWPPATWPWSRAA